MARLVQLKDGEETVYALNRKVTYVGRKSTCDIIIADGSASRHHARIVNDANDYLIVDTQSRNGTLVNGQKIQQKFLTDGDRVQIGTGVFTFLLEEADKKSSFQLSRYEIMEKVGRGGMGIVYKARQKSMDRIVALKVLNERFASDKGFVERFIREAQAAGKLSHPNIIHVHDVSKEKGLYYFSMEFVSGPSVMRLLIEREQIPPEESIEIIKQVAKALDFAHTNNLIHRDIKPDNIMVTEDNEVKLADLGIARNIEEANDELQQKTIYGTPLYMAPEQAMGRQVDHRLDIYSLGATFFHMTTGEPPFQGTTAIELLKKHINEPLPAPDDINPDIPPAMANMIEVMMAKDPEERYQNAAEIVSEIELIQRGESVSSKRLAFSETSILRKLSGTEKDLEPSVHVVDFASDERVQELISMDPRKRKTIVFSILFIAALIGLFFLIIYISDIVNTGDGSDGGLEDNQPLISDNLEDRAQRLRADGNLKEEAVTLGLLLDARDPQEPAYTAMQNRHAVLTEFLARENCEEQLTLLLKAYDELLLLKTTSPDSLESIVSRAQNCLTEDFKRLFPDRSQRAEEILDEYKNRYLTKRIEAEAAAFTALQAIANTGPDGYFAMKKAASDYIKRFNDLEPDHLQKVQTELKKAEEGLASITRMINEQRQKELETLDIQLESSFESGQYSQIYSLCENMKTKYRNTVWESKADEVLNTYKSKLDALYKRELVRIENDFKNGRYQKVFSSLNTLNDNFRNTPFTEQVAKKTAGFKRKVKNEYNSLLARVKEDTESFNYSQARLSLLREVHNFMGTPYKEKLEVLSKDYDIISTMWDFLQQNGEQLQLPLSIEIIKSGDPNILRGMNNRGIHLQILSDNQPPANFVKWDKLDDKQRYEVFKTALIGLKASDAHLKGLAVFCRHAGLKTEAAEIEKLITAGAE